MLDLRFEETLTKPETPYMYAGAGVARYATSSRFYVMTARAKTGLAEKTLEELLRAKESIIRYGFTGAELALVSNSLVSDLQQMVQEKDRQESNDYVQSLTGYFLTGGNLASVEWELEAAQQLLPHIGAKDINAAIKDYFSGGDLQVFVFAPDAERSSLPNDARIKRMVAESRKMKIAPPQSGAVEGDLLSVTPNRGAVVSESVDRETGAVMWNLNNGARVILKSTTNKNDEIVLQAMARGGTSSVAPRDGVSASLAVEMVQVSGLGPWSRPELTRMLTGKQVSLSYFVSHYYRGFRGSSTSGDLKTLFEMLYLNFTDSRIDPVAVQAMMDTYATSLALRGENPRTVFSDEINRTIYSGNPRFKPLERADLPKANIDTALAFVRKGLNPADYTFIFTGNLKPETIKDYIETYLASIPPGENWNTWTDLNITRPGKVERTVRKGKEEQSTVYMAWFSKSPFSDELNAVTQVLTEYLDIKMTEEIREKLGGVYSISVNVPLSPVPQGELSLLVYFACDPKRVGELTAAVSNLLQQTVAGIDRDIFGKSVEALKKEWETSMQSNAYIAQSYANSAVLLNLPLSRLNRRPRYYDAVTPADIQKICAQLVRSSGPAQVILLPE
jgi:zinc protease